MKLDAATLYLHTSQCVIEATQLAVDSFGAMGYMSETKATELMQDAKIFQTGGGSIEIRKLLIGHLLTQLRAYWGTNRRNPLITQDPLDCVARFFPVYDWGYTWVVMNELPSCEIGGGAGTAFPFLSSTRGSMASILDWK